MLCSSIEGNKERKGKMVTYIVSINYNEFEFINASTAMNFAELAKTSSIKDVDVAIDLRVVPKPEKGEDDDF